ncbi:MAG: DNA translocase FtsK [Deltaproteobacteria bacterium]|nr:DNA translocase FtsK [Deltaproteobacteria bacterium]
MGVERKPQVEEQSSGGEVLGVVTIAAAVFLTLACYSYRSGNADQNQVGLIGHLFADFLCQAFGRTCYLIPLGQLYFAGVFLRLWSCSAPVSQMCASLVFLFASATFLALWEDGVPIVKAGGWIGGFLAFHLRTGLNRLGAYVVLTPVLVASLRSVMRFSLHRAGAGMVTSSLSSLMWVWATLRKLALSLPHLTLPRLAWEQSSAPGPEAEPEFVRAKRPTRKESPVKKTPLLLRPEEEDEGPEVSRPPIIFSQPPPPAPAKIMERVKPDTTKAALEPTLPNGKHYTLPAVSLLDPPVRLAVKVDEDALLASSRILESKLADFGVDGKVVAVRPGPVITTYEYEPAPGVKVNRVVSLADDLQMALRAVSVRIIAPIPGKAVVGIEVSNPRREKVMLREIIESPGFQETESPLTLALGKDTVGNPVVADLARMPHLLVAGATGTGKSVSLNVMIMSMLYRALPRDVRFIMIDPKMLELSLYEDLPHQLSHVITNPKEAGAALQEVVRRMEYRYHLLKDKGVRNIAAYNRVIDAGQPNAKGIIKLTEVVEVGEEDDDTRTASHAASKTTPLIHQRLPYLVVIVDELADLMLTVGRDIEEPITRLAQMGRAAGIHLILATQRPSVDVITGLIKANFPARVSFQVSSRIDSRTILDAIGAERLLGDGDMLFLPPGSAKPQRIHGAFVSEPEIRKAVAAMKKQGKPSYDAVFVAALEKARSTNSADGVDEDDQDEMYEQARDLVMESHQASISWLQRRLRVGYNRAARMIERMEREGLIGPSAEAGKPREVLVRSAASGGE